MSQNHLSLPKAAVNPKGAHAFALGSSCDCSTAFWESLAPSVDALGYFGVCRVGWGGTLSVCLVLAACFPLPQALGCYDVSGMSMGGERCSW